MAELPLEIHDEILVRSKAKDLIRYKSVCKSWNSLISNECFVKSHLNYVLKQKAENTKTGDTRIVLAGPSSNAYDCHIVGSSNGLVCIHFRTELLVVNPSTRQVKKIQKPSQIPDLTWRPVYALLGFGYDASTDDYKVVIGFRNTTTDKYRFLVLTLETNFWKSVALQLDYYYMFRNSVLCNGAVHRIAIDRNNNPILVSFDLSREVFNEIPAPMALQASDFFIGNGQHRLGTIEDRLCIFRGNSRTPSNQRDLWLIKNYNIQESESIWEQILSPPLFDDSDHETMMDYVPRKSFSDHIHIWMVGEDSGAPVYVQSIRSPHGKAHIWVSTISECNYNYDEHVFVRSLVSPHGMGNDNGNSNEGKVTRKIDNIISHDDRRSVKSKKESFVSQKYDVWRAKRKRQSLVSTDSDGDKRRSSKQ